MYGIGPGEAGSLSAADRGCRPATGVEVRGTLWLMGEMMEANVVAVDRAAAAYEVMRADGSRLPWNEVDAQIKAFRKR